MEIAELVLDYVRALAWPLIVLLLVYLFRSEIADKIKHLSKASTPVGTAEFDSKAAQVEQDAERAAEKVVEKDSELPKESTPKPRPTRPPDTTTREELADEGPAEVSPRSRMALRSALRALIDAPDFGAAEEVVVSAPDAAVILAYRELEAIAQAGWTIEHLDDPRPRPGSMVLRDLARTDAFSEFAPVVAELSQLRNATAHSRTGAGVSPVGAKDYIDACRQFATAIHHRAMSKLRHPSRAHLVKEWLNDIGAPKPD
jgi:hypothetical protein